MASSTMQTCHLPKETRHAPRKPIPTPEGIAGRSYHASFTTHLGVPRRLPGLGGVRSLLAAAAGQENSIPQRLIETKPRNFFSFLYTLRHGLLTMPAFPAPCDAIDLAGDDFVRRWSQTCASPYNASDSIGG
jgi:hypothetical protein